MKLQIVLIDEPIHIENEFACKLWQKALWAKEKGYREHYKTSIMPIGADDFFASHFIVAEVKANGEYEPVAMAKTVSRKQCERFNIPFGATALLKNAVINSNDEKIFQSVLEYPEDICYTSSWTINPAYKKDKDLSKVIRDYATLYLCNYFKSVNVPRWLSAGVTTFKMDKFLEWTGGKEIIPEFSLPIIDGQTVRMLYAENAYNPPAEPLAIANALNSEWENRLIFQPTTNNKKEKTDVIRAA